MKKDDRREKLSEWLLQTDDDLLNEAYRIDSAEQLKKRTEGEKTVRKTIHMRKYAVRKLVAAALCLLIIFGVLLAVPALFGRDEPTVSPPAPDGLVNVESSKPAENTQDTTSAGVKPPDGNGTGDNGLPNIVFPTGDLHIDSLDMLNYYSAIRLLADSPRAALSDLSAGRRTSRGIGLLAAGENTSSLETTEAPPPEPEQPSRPPESSDASEEPGIYYYDLDPDDIFFVTKTSLFQIELTEEAGFLASKLGTGVADVVITEGYIGYYDDPIITFKNGDRYFSCLLNGYSALGFDDFGNVDQYLLEFSTHKYIEGFCIVKNFEQVNYKITVTFDGDQAVDLMCSGWDRVEDGDGPLHVVSKTCVSTESAGYTVAELEGYFNSEPLPEKPPVAETPGNIMMAYCSEMGNYLLLRDDGSFEYGPSETYWDVWQPRRGTYELTEDSLILRFYEEGEPAEEAVISLLMSSGLYYNEERFLPCKGLGASGGVTYAVFCSESNGRFTFTDNGFKYDGVDGSGAAFSRRGAYECDGDTIRLLFSDGEETVVEFRRYDTPYWYGEFRYCEELFSSKQ